MNSFVETNGNGRKTKKAGRKKSARREEKTHRKTKTISECVEIVGSAILPG